MGKVVLVAVAISLTGCALFMTPEERDARRHAREMSLAMSMSPVNLCYRYAFDRNAPNEVFQAVHDRSINCETPQMIELMAIKQRQIAAEQVSNQEAARQTQNLGLEILRQNQRRPTTTCTMIGNTMSCY